MWKGLQSQLIPHSASKDACWEKSHQCNKCGETFYRWTNLSYPSRTSFREGLFECNHWGKCFARGNIFLGVWSTIPKRNPSSVFTVRKTCCWILLVIWRVILEIHSVESLILHLIIYPGERPSRYCAHRKTFSCIFLLSLQCNVISGIIFKRRGRHRKNEMQAQIFSDFSAKPMVLCHRFLNVFGGREMFQGKGPWPFLCLCVHLLLSSVIIVCLGKVCKL